MDEVSLGIKLENLKSALYLEKRNSKSLKGRINAAEERIAALEKSVHLINLARNGPVVMEAFHSSVRKKSHGAKSAGR